MISAEGVAWFFMGEGSCGLCIAPAKGKQENHHIGYRISPEIKIANSDIEMINVAAAWLTANKISNHVIKIKRDGSYCLHFGCLAAMRFLQAVYPYLVGDKKKIADIIEEYYAVSWIPLGQQNKYKPNRYRFLLAVQLHDRICNINNTNHRKKYDVAFFLKRFSLKSIEEAKNLPLLPSRKNSVIHYCEYCKQPFNVGLKRSNRVNVRFCSLNCRRESASYKKQHQVNPKRLEASL